VPKVLNKHHLPGGVIPPGAVYIGRGSPWGNPFRVGKDYARGDAITAYEALITSHPEIIEDIKRELKDKDLVCFCKPRACHGDILLRIANED